MCSSNGHFLRFFQFSDNLPNFCVCRSGKNGRLRIWNFNNGALLRDLMCYDKCELTSIVCSKMLIITGGWNKRISTYVDLVSHVLRHVLGHVLYLMCYVTCYFSGAKFRYADNKLELT